MDNSSFICAGSILILNRHLAILISIMDVLLAEILLRVSQKLDGSAACSDL